MTTEISRNVIMDLLPLYLADELSPDSKALVEKALSEDPELAEIVKNATVNHSIGEIPVPLTKDDAMESYNEAKRWMTIRMLGLAALGTILFLCTLTSVGAMLMMWLRLGF